MVATTKWTQQECKREWIIDEMKLDLANYKNRHSLRSKLARAVWNVVWLFFFRTTPRGLFYGWRRFLVRLFGGKIGRGVNILPSAKIWQPWLLEMGDYSCLSENVECYTVDRIKIGEQAVISQGAFLCTASHDMSSPTMELTHEPIVIEEQAWIAARAFVAPGVTIGEGAVVGACSVVTKDVAPWTVVAGNPARVVKVRKIEGSKDA